jgi:hypothetical protein
MTRGRQLSALSRPIIVVALLCILSTSVGALSVAGFCFKEHRFLTDREMTEIALRDVLGQQSVQVTRRGPQGISFIAVPVIERPSVRDFLSKNPNCCKLFTPGAGAFFVPDLLINRLFGAAAIGVQIKRSIKDNRNPENPATYDVTGETIIGNCGAILNLGY